MSLGVFITGVGSCKEVPTNIETIKSVKTLLRAEELALAATSIALKQTGFSLVQAANLNQHCGIIFGIDNAIDRCKSDFFRGLLSDGPLGASPLLFPYTSTNAITAQVTIAFAIKGENITITSGPLSFLKAVGYGFELLNRGVMQSVFAGGASENEAMVIKMEVLDKGEIVNRSVIGELIVCKDAPPEDWESIGQIEDSFRLMENALKKSDRLNLAGYMLRVKT